MSLIQSYSEPRYTNIQIKKVCFYNLYLYLLLVVIACHMKDEEVVAQVAD